MGPGITLKDLKLFRDLGLTSQLRGTDGAGVYQIRSSTSGKKNFWNLEQLYRNQYGFTSLHNMIDDNKNHKDYRELLQNQSVDLIIGHNRAATIGDVRQSNCHPFVKDNIVGAHNGTLYEKQYYHITKTDSELMFEDIDKNGLVEVLRDFRDPKSAYAITMYDRNDRHMYFVRNDLRTLAFAFNEDRGVMYWASELGMLKYIVGERGGEKIKTFSLKPGLVVRLSPSDITLNNIRNNADKIITVHEWIAPPKETIVVKVPPEEDKTLALPAPVKTEKVDNFDVAGSAKGNVVPFPKTPALRAFHAKCACGKKDLNLLTISYARRKKTTDIRYNEHLDCYYCAECDPLLLESKDEVRQ
jgi:hypothetical protein